MNSILRLALLTTSPRSRTRRRTRPSGFGFGVVDRFRTRYACRQGHSKNRSTALRVALGDLHILAYADPLL